MPPHTLANNTLGAAREDVYNWLVYCPVQTRVANSIPKALLNQLRSSYANGPSGSVHLRLSAGPHITRYTHFRSLLPAAAGSAYRGAEATTLGMTPCNFPASLRPCGLTARASPLPP